MILKLALILFICICRSAIAVTNFTSPAPYFLDEKLEQSVVFKSLNSKENEFQFEMADFLGLTERPRRIKKPLSLRTAASKFLLELYNALTEEDEPHFAAYHNRDKRSTLITKEDRTEIDRCNNVITFSSKQYKSRHIAQARDMILTFNTNHVPQDLQLLRAELRIFQNSKVGRKFVNKENVTVLVFRKVLNRKLQKIDLKLLSSLSTTTNYKGWLEANVTPIISKWISGGYSVGGHDLIISTNLRDPSNEAIPEQAVTPKDIGLINVSGTGEYQPFIIGYFNGPELLNKIQHMRFKRDMAKTKRHTPEYHIPQEGRQYYNRPKPCERMHFSIDFKDLQMQDWVIAPRKFEAYFCTGDCNFPLGSQMNATNHAIVQTLMHLKQPKLPTPCCVPTVLGSISILHYLNEDSVNLSKYRNSVAKSCGCL